jgi:hypothetical protein
VDRRASLEKLAIVGFYVETSRRHLEYVRGISIDQMDINMVMAVRAGLDGVYDQGDQGFKKRYPSVRCLAVEQQMTYAIKTAHLFWEDQHQSDEA